MNGVICGNSALSLINAWAGGEKMGHSLRLSRSLRRQPWPGWTLAFCSPSSPSIPAVTAAASTWNPRWYIKQPIGHPKKTLVFRESPNFWTSPPANTSLNPRSSASLSPPALVASAARWAERYATTPAPDAPVNNVSDGLLRTAAALRRNVGRNAANPSSTTGGSASP